jgi:hypothetical protein
MSAFCQLSDRPYELGEQAVVKNYVKIQNLLY